MSDHSINLIWRRGSETLDCRVEGIAEPSCRIEVKSASGSNLDLLVETSVRLDVAADADKRQVNEAPEQNRVQKSSDVSGDGGVRNAEWARGELNRGDARQLDISRLGLGSFRQQGLHGQANQAAQLGRGSASVTAGQFSATTPIKREDGK